MHREQRERDVLLQVVPLASLEPSKCLLIQIWGVVQALRTQRRLEREGAKVASRPMFEDIPRFRKTRNLQRGPGVSAKSLPAQ